MSIVEILFLIRLKMDHHSSICTFVSRVFTLYFFNTNHFFLSFRYIMCCCWYNAFLMYPADDIQFNFLLKVLGFPSLSSVPSCRRQGPCCLILHTQPLNPATQDAVTVTDCKTQSGPSAKPRLNDVKIHMIIFRITISVVLFLRSCS